MYSKIYDKLEKIKNLKVKQNIPLKKYTSFKIGGPASLFIIPDTIKALQKCIPLLTNNNIPFFVLGKGSNLIISDKGYQGVVIYSGNLNQIEIEDTRLTAETGISLALLANKALEAGLTGLEFASGIPGSLGGALYMNAGAYGGEMKDIITKALLLDHQGQKVLLSKKELALSYRSSILQQKKLISVRVSMNLKHGDKNKIKNYMSELNKKRKEKQPLSWPSVGSIFKRPENNYSGTLIEKAGLKGMRVGDAQVSEKHAGFIINRGKATAQDVYKLIKIVQKKVFETSGITLEVEPKFVGNFNL
ncbi:MAG: UDP-N-acetylmuramate dehydrogenase [Halanaerobiales bacterium]